MKSALDRHGDGKNKGFLCVAAAFPSVYGLDEALIMADKGEDVRDLLTRYAEERGK